MNTERIIEAIRLHDSTPVGISHMEAWSDVASNLDVRDYLNSCVTEEGFNASGIGVLGVSKLDEENAEDVVPGGQLRKYGYVVITISVGGNAVVLSSNDGRVYWADHSYFADDVEISYKDRETGEWHFVPWSPKNVLNAIVLLSNSIENFLLDLIAGLLENRLDDLD